MSGRSRLGQAPGATRPAPPRSWSVTAASWDLPSVAGRSHATPHPNQAAQRVRPQDDTGSGASSRRREAGRRSPPRGPLSWVPLQSGGAARWTGRIPAANGSINHRKELPGSMVTGTAGAADGSAAPTGRRSPRADAQVRRSLPTAGRSIAKDKLKRAASRGSRLTTMISILVLALDVLKLLGEGHKGIHHGGIKM